MADTRSKRLWAGPNLYAYVFNSPLTHVDLYGLMAQSDSHSLFRRTMESLVKLPGRALEWIGRNLVPVPFARDALELSGRVLRGGCIRHYIPSYAHQRSFYGVYPGSQGELSPKGSYFISNGVGVTWNEFYSRVEKASADLNGTNVGFVYNSTHGLALDALEWLCQRLGIRTHADRTMKTALINMGSQLLHVGNAEIWSELHSQSNEMLNLIKSQLPERIKEMMVVKSFGSPYLHSPKDYKSAMNYVSAFDASTPSIGSDRDAQGKRLLKRIP